MSTVIEAYSALGLRSLYDNEEINKLEMYIQDSVKSHGFDLGIDCSADERCDFHTIGYSLIAGHFIIYPLSRIAYSTLIQGILSSPLRSVRKPMLSVDKYENNFESYPNKIDVLCVLPGSNLLKVVVDKKILTELNKLDNVVVKLHPLTTDIDKNLLREIFNSSVVIVDEYPLQSLLSEAEVVYTTLASESSIRSVILGKELKSLELDIIEDYTMYSHLTRPLFTLPTEARMKYLENIVYSEISCMIQPTDKMAFEQVDKCLDYVVEIRDKIMR